MGSLSFLQCVILSPNSQMMRTSYARSDFLVKKNKTKKHHKLLFVRAVLLKFKYDA